MYGWIEPSCVKKNFSYTNDIDIVFRSSSFSNNIVLGNEYPNVVNAAIYISSNCIGIQKVPDSSLYALDIDARARFKYIDIGNFSIDESNLYSDKMNLNCNGLFENILTLTNDIKKQINILNDIQIISIDFQNNKYYIEFAYTDSLRLIQINLLLKIETEVYIVTDLLTSSTFVLQPYFSNSVTQLSTGDVVTIHVYQDFIFDNTYNINVLFTVTSYTTSSVTNSISINFENIINSEFLLIDKHYMVFDNIFILKSFDMNTSHIVLYSLTNNVYQISSGTRTSMQYIDILIPETIDENNVRIGTYTDTTGNKLLIQKSRLSNMVKDKTNCVRSFIFNNSLQYDLLSIWVDANSNLVADFSNTNNTFYIYSTRGKFSYNIIGYPLRVIGKSGSGSGSLYLFDDPLGLFSIWDINVYNMLFICNNNFSYQINDIDKTNNSILFDNILDFQVGTFIYAIPYNTISNYTKLGKSKYCYISGKLAIGTSNPIATDTLTVNGNISCDSVIFKGDAQEQFTLKYDSNAFLINNSIEIQNNITTIKQDLIVEGNLTKQINILNDIQIISIDFQNNKYYIEFVYTDSLRSIQSNLLLKIETELYIVTDLLTSSTFVLQPYFSNSVTQLNIGDMVTIHVYQDVMLDNTYNINILFTVTSSILSSVTNSISINFENITNSEFLLIDKHYMVFDNIFILKFFDINTSHIVLYSLTKNVYPISSGTQASMQYIGGILTPETIDENNILIGTYTDDTGNKLLIQNSRLSNMIKDKTICVNSILFNNSLQYDLLSIWVDANSNLVADFSNKNNTSYIYSTRGKFSYNIIGYPLRVIGKNSSLYVFDDPLGLLSIWDINVYNMLFICNNNFGYQINDIDKTNNSILFNNILNFEIDTFIYVIPYNTISNYTKLGKSKHCYISGKLAIGTLGRTSNPIATETLTVNGNISCNNCVIFNDGTEEQFTIKYDSNAFLINNSIEIQNNITTIKHDLIVEGNLTSSHYLTYSDRKLKRKIHISDPHEDLSKLQQINIYDFKYKNGKQKHKGVMAQELQKQLPFLIQKNRGYMPSICKYGRITNKINCIIVYDIDKDILKDLLKEKYLRIYVNGKKKDVYMEKVHIKKNSVIIYTCVNYKIGTKVYIHGPLATYKTIDTNYLLMMLINSIKLL